MKERVKKVATEKQAVLAVISILLALIIGFAVLKIDGIIMLTIATIISAIFAYSLGYSWEDMMKAVSAKISEAVPAILILLSIGVLVGTWMASGTIPAMIYYGLQVVNPQYLFVTAFLVCTVISIATGTSWGTVGTIGVALIGVGIGLDISLPMVAGAVISGAYFGDKMSPLSDTTNMAALAAKANLYDHIKQMFVTTVPAMIIACIVFTVWGLNIDVTTLNSEIYTNMLADLSANFDFNILLLLPPVIVILGAITKKPTVPALIASSAVAILLAIFVQGFDLNVAMNAAKSGFNAGVAFAGVEFSPEVLTLLNRGGATSMYEGSIYVVVAFAFGGILQLTNCLEIALRKVMKPLKTPRSFVNAAGFSAATIVAIAQNSYISYFLVSNIFGKKFKDYNLKEQNLSRVLEDFVTVTEGLMPWTVSGIYMATTLGVATMDYLPFAVFNYSCTIISIIYALTYDSIGKFAFSYKDKNNEEKVDSINVA